MSNISPEEFCLHISIAERISFFATLHVWCSRRFTPEEVRFFESHNADNFVSSKAMDKQPWWRGKVVLQLPNAAVLERLRGIRDEGAGLLICRADVSLDLIVATQKEADELHQWLLLRLRKRWHGQRRLNRFETTSNFQRRKWSVNSIAIYSHRASKVREGQHCCHVEWKLMGAANVKQRGIVSLENLEGFDHRAFWSKALILEEPIFEKLGRANRGRERLAGKRLARLAHYRADCLMPIECSQQIRDYFRPKKLLRDAFRPVDNEWLLPDAT